MEKLEIFDENVRIAILKLYPEMQGIHRFMIKAVITKTAAGLVELQPLNAENRMDEDHPSIPGVRLPYELTATPVGAVVRIGFYYADPDQPYIDGLV